MGPLPPESDTKFRNQSSISAYPRQSSSAMLAIIDGTESLPREATLPDSRVSRTTEPDTSKRRANNGSLFIHRLPTEIFIHIITLVLADHRPNSNPWMVYTRTGELKLVCVLWADRINFYPRFWDVLTNRLGPELVPAVLRRSRAVPLHVEMVPVPNQDIQAYITVIKSCAHRWATLDIICVGVNEAVLHDLLQVPAPQLQKLSIAGFSAPPKTAIHLFGGQAPLIHTVMTTPNEWSIIRPIVPRLKHLTVDKIRFPAREFSELRLDMIVQALTESPEIEVLELCDLESQSAASLAAEATIPSSPILLSRLRSITIDPVFSKVAFKLLAAITFPRDCAFNIYMWDTPSLGSLNPVLSILYAQFTQVAPLGIDIRFAPWILLIVLSYERDGAGRTEITVKCSGTDVDRMKRFVEDVLHQLGEAIRASNISVHLRIGRLEVDDIDYFPREAYESIVETVDGLLPSTTRASIYGLYFTDFITYAKSGFSKLSELIIEETSIITPWEQLVELAKSRSTQAADPGSRVAALESISLPSKGLDEAAREGVSRVVGQVNWTDDPEACQSPALPMELQISLGLPNSLW